MVIATESIKESKINMTTEKGLQKVKVPALLQSKKTKELRIIQDDVLDQWLLKKSLLQSEGQQKDNEVKSWPNPQSR